MGAASPGGVPSPSALMFIRATRTRTASMLGGLNDFLETRLLATVFGMHIESWRAIFKEESPHEAVCGCLYPSSS